MRDKLKSIIREAKRFGYFNKGDMGIVLEALDKIVSEESLQVEIKPKEKKYNHAYTIAFALETDNVPDKVTAQELLVALVKKVSDIIEEENIIECTGLPYDSYEN